MYLSSSRSLIFNVLNICCCFSAGESQYHKKTLLLTEGTEQTKFLIHTQNTSSTLHQLVKGCQSETESAQRSLSGLQKYLYYLEFQLNLNLHVIDFVFLISFSILSFSGPDSAQSTVQPQVTCLQESRRMLHPWCLSWQSHCNLYSSSHGSASQRSQRSSRCPQHQGKAC